MKSPLDCRKLCMTSAVNLSVVGGGRHPSAVTGPVCVQELAGVVQTLVGVSTEVVALRLVMEKYKFDK